MSFQKTDIVYWWEIEGKWKTRMKTLGQYSKAIAAVLTQALTYAALHYGTNKYVAAAVALAGAIGVFAVPNTKKETVTPPLAPKTNYPPQPPLPPRS
jgi:hypothetical protein